MRDRIVLVSPPTDARAYGWFRPFASLSPPIGPALVAACLERAGFDVSLWDADALGLSFSRTVDILSRDPARLVGLTGMTAQMAEVIRLAKALKAKAPDKRIVLGGVHASALPERTLADEESIDYIVRGEGEETAVELFGALAGGSPLASLEQIEGIAYRNGGRVRVTAARPHIKDLDALPLPAYHLLPMHAYRSYGWNAWDDGVRGPYGSVHTGRGCPYKCTFCDAQVTLGRKRRARSIDSVLKELDLLTERYGVKSVRFEDETLMVNKNRAFKLCQALGKRNYGVKFSAAGRVDEVSRDLLESIKAAGFTWINYGVESGNEAVLKSIGKEFSLKQVREAMAMTEAAGLYTMGSFMLGLPGETEASCLDTIRFACALNPDYAGFACVIPFPGTAIYRYALEQRIPLPRDWSAFGQMNSRPIPLNPDLGEFKLNRLLRRAHYGFFLRPAYLRKIFSRFNAKVVARDFATMAPAVLKFFGV